MDLATKTLEETLKDLPENPEAGEVEVESVKVTVNKTELKVGETTTAKAVITPDNATDQTVSWTTSDESVITVDKDGQITAKKIGKANVIATASNGKTDKVEITWLLKRKRIQNRIMETMQKIIRIRLRIRSRKRIKRKILSRRETHSLSYCALEQWWQPE